MCYAYPIDPARSMATAICLAIIDERHFRALSSLSITSSWFCGTYSAVRYYYYYYDCDYCGSWLIRQTTHLSRSCDRYTTHHVDDGVDSKVSLKTNDETRRDFCLSTQRNLTCGDDVVHMVSNYMPWCCNHNHFRSRRDDYLCSTCCTCLCDRTKKINTYDRSQCVFVCAYIITRFCGRVSSTE